MNMMSDQLTLWVINVLIHSTVLTASSLLVATMFRRRAAMRYWILCCGLLLVLASPAISAAVQSRGSSWLALAAPSELAVVPVPESLPRAEQAETTSTAQADLSQADLSPSETSPIEMEPATALPPDPMSPPSPEIKAPIAAGLPSIASEPAPVEAEEPRWLMPWMTAIAAVVSLIWLTGAAVLLLRMSIGWFRLSRILKRAESFDDAGFQAAFAKACSAVGCGDRRAPLLVASDEVSGPLAAGLGSGYVVLPKQLIASTDPDELADVLIHEVAHIVRRDQIVVLIQNLASAIYWPHPLVRLLNRELAKAREEVCDNFVLGTTEAPVYSRTLLSLAQLLQRPETMPGSVGFFASRWKLEQRVAGLLDENRDKQTILSRRGWAFVIASTVGLLAAICVGTVTIATAQNSNQDSLAESDTPSRSMTVEGIVRNPDGKPIAGARVIALQHFRANSSWTTDSVILAETTSNQMGRYQMQVEPDSNRFSNGMYLEKEHLSVLATLAGFGPDEQTFFDNETIVDLNLADAQQDVTGQIVDLEGKPIKGVQVRLLDLQQPPTAMDRSDTVDKWIEAAKRVSADGEDGPDNDPFERNTLQPRVAFYPAAEHLRGIAVLDIRTQTDDEGRFRLPGIGDDRQAILQIDGAGVASSLIPVVARKMSPINTPWMGPQYRTGKTFGSQFRLSAEPEQIVQGVVKDRETGQPISGASISLYQLPGGLLAINGFLSATSDVEGRYVLHGIPRNTKQSGGTIKIKVNPPRDQPYFRSEHQVPVAGGLEPIRFDMALTRGIWATGRVTESKSGEPVPGLVGYHPYINNPNAANHEAFDPNVTSMGYGEMFATNIDGTFRVPALRGAGILRAVAKNDDQYQLATIPGTKMGETGNIRPGERKIYHNIMPGNGVVALNVDDGASVGDSEITLTRVPSLTVDVVNPDGTPATGFRVAGRRLANRVTLSGRGYRFWEDEPSLKSTVEVMLGDDSERDRPLILLHKERRLGAVVWLSEVDPDGSRLTVQLQPTGKIIGRFVGGSDDPSALPYVQVGIGDARKISAMFQTNGGSQIKVSKHLPFGIQGVLRADESGNFEIIVPASDRCTVLLKNFPGNPLLLDNKPIGLGATIDLGTIDLKANPKSWPKPLQIRANSSPVSGQVVGPDGQPVGAKLWIGGPARSGNWSRTPTTVNWTRVGTSTADGRFQIPIPQPERTPVKSGPLVVRIAATAEGLGFAWKDVTVGEPSDDVTLQLVKDTPIRGRIVTLDGTPAANVRLDVVSVVAPDSLPDSAEFAKSEKLSSGIYTNWPGWPGGSPLTKPVVTDSDGRFLLSGLGSERHVRLQAKRDGLAATRISIVTREKPSDSANGAIAVRSGLSESKYFANFTHVAMPGRIIRGTVVDQANGKPIPDVRVVEPTSWASRRQPSLTDADGNFMIRHVPKATEYKLELSPVAGNHLRSEVTVPDTTGSESLDVKLTLTPGIRLRGRVVDEVSGDGVQAEIIYNPLFPNDAIELRGVEDVANPLSKVQTETDGRFEIPVLHGPGAISAEVSGEEYATTLLKKEDLREIFPDGDLEARPDAMGQFNYLPTVGGGRSRGIMGLSNVHAVKLLNPRQGGSLEEIVLPLRRSVTVQGEIFDRQGKPITGVTVVGLGPSRASMTDEPLKTNRFSVKGLLPKSERTLLFLHTGRSLGAIVNVKGDETDTVRVKLKPTGSVSGLLRNVEGDSIKTGYVTLRPRRIGLLTGLWMADLDDEGRFEVDNLIAGEKFDLHVRTDAQRMKMFVREGIQVEAGQSLDVGTFRQKDQYRFAPDEMTAKMHEKELQP